MDKPLLKNSLHLFEKLGAIKCRSMFGGFGIFSGDVMFALVVNDKLHFRADSLSQPRYEQLGMTPYIYTKRGFPVITKYFAIVDTWWNTPNQIFVEGEQAYLTAKKDQETKRNQRPSRLKDLPNLRLGTERMLKKVGIDSVDKLYEMGSIEAYKAIEAHQDSPLNIELLWALEGAILGKHWSVLSLEHRQALKEAVEP
ncbi:DNA transformation protein TfoX1 [Vibrio stylophorae]|uniref:DNA transformation protein TfoX1 n=1 Tax=Vibrio stylophorae TaxID=659351 RepID=A0ABM8ZRX4_9VIBR|nr:TfoX/Sxy family DNA transformation protein [Vibrio stylophorae]CAH0533048.1 DNA transformation protein TfoX1 [Vibrio stylophorae]